MTPFNAEYEAGSGSNQEAGSDTGSSTEMDLDAYEQVLRRAEPVMAYRRVPASFAHTLDACLQPDPTRRPTLEELTRTLEALS